MDLTERFPLYVYSGIEQGFRVKLINEPDEFKESLNGFYPQINFHSRLKDPVDLIHLFTRSKKELMVELPALAKYIKEEGTLWVSWPDKNSNHISDLDEKSVREIGLLNGLVEMEFGTIGGNWSVLKFKFRSGE